jgi:hypothetical protein
MPQLFSTVLYDSYQDTTTEQRRQMKAFSDCRARIGAAARPSAAEITGRRSYYVPAAKSPPPQPLPVFSLDDWIERQKKIPLPPAQPECMRPCAAAPIPHAPEQQIPPKQQIAIRDIQIACAKFGNVGLKEILSASRRAKYVRPRQIAMYLARELTDRSTLKIGRAFGGRDHTTILSGVRKIARLIKVDADLALAVAALTAELEG